MLQKCYKNITIVLSFYNFVVSILEKCYYLYRIAYKGRILYENHKNYKNYTNNINDIIHTSRKCSNGYINIKQWYCSDTNGNLFDLFNPEDWNFLKLMKHLNKCGR